MIRITERIEKAVGELTAIDKKKLFEAEFEAVCLKYEVDPDIVERVMFGKAGVNETRENLLRYILAHRTISDIKAIRLGCHRPARRFEELHKLNGMVVRKKTATRKDGVVYTRFELYRA